MLPWAKDTCIRAKKAGYEDIIVVCGKGYRPFRRAIKGALVTQFKGYRGAYDSELILHAYRFLNERTLVTVIKEGLEIDEGNLVKLYGGESLLVGESCSTEMGVCCEGRIAHSINPGIGLRYLDAVTLEARHLVSKGNQLCLMEVARNRLLEKSLVAFEKNKG